MANAQEDPEMTRLEPAGRAGSRGAVATREALVRAAEQLFAVRGVDNVTLAQIHKRAGQRNNSAIPYHFGGINGLITAVLEKHAPRLHERFAQIIASLPHEPTTDDFTRAQVQAVMDRLGDPDGGIEFVQIVSQLAGHPEFSAWCVWDLIRRSRGPMLVTSKTRAHASLSTTPEARIRSIIGHNVIVHSIADYARLHQAGDPSAPEPDVFLEQLLAASVAAANALSFD